MTLVFLPFFITFEASTANDFLCAISCSLWLLGDCLNSTTCCIWRLMLLEWNLKTLYETYVSQLFPILNLKRDAFGIMYHQSPGTWEEYFHTSYFLSINYWSCGTLLNPSQQIFRSTNRPFLDFFGVQLMTAITVIFIYHIMFVFECLFLCRLLFPYKRGRTWSLSSV